MLVVAYEYGLPMARTSSCCCIVQNKVLVALRNNDLPSLDYVMQVLFGYSNPESQITEQIRTNGLAPAQYKNILCMSEDNLALLLAGNYQCKMGLSMRVGDGQKSQVR